MPAGAVRYLLGEYCNLDGFKLSSQSPRCHSGEQVWLRDGGFFVDIGKKRLL